MYSELEKHISKHIQLTTEEWDLFTSVLINKKLRKKQYLIQEGDIVEYEYYVVKGCLKAYRVDSEENEHIVQFAIEDWWISDFKAFFKEERARLNIDCIEDTELIGIKKEDLEILYLKIPNLERFFRIKLTSAFVSFQDRILSALEKTSAERYLEFQEAYPNIKQRIPNYQIANYLGIKPESLSRLRKQIQNNS
ncbi:Crp/Fnr family transcriptional regulator [Aquimarina sp. 2201CG5-10]|uniref:Crp/Fnr family transcriptional regulator n=1 Tax=Aquimarina callyspongiae TaxID=3098150 RepID=UPI002AB3A1DE|nr:Crp/Fnr family transcriptional regulator [Aquimarina sp. 2201CG5-10]MDY8138603.1 Crp/Fnr family transcriptional regulator [Aquimarina sp. 2201CG5-10]